MPAERESGSMSFGRRGGSTEFRALATGLCKPFPHVLGVEVQLPHVLQQQALKLVQEEVGAESIQVDTTIQSESIQAEVQMGAELRMLV